MASPFEAAARAALASLFDTHGHGAVHDPDGAAMPCRLVWDAPQIQSGFTELGGLYSEAGRAAVILVSDVPGVAAGDTFAVGAARWTVTGDPVHPPDDPERLLWHLLLTEAP